MQEIKQSPAFMVHHHIGGSGPILNGKLIYLPYMH